MRHLIWMMPLALALALTLTATPAYAWHCPKLAAEAKDVIAKAEAMGGNEALIKEAKELEADGEKYHNEGKHNEAMEHLAKSIKKAVYAVTGGEKESMGSMRQEMKGHKSEY